LGEIAASINPPTERRMMPTAVRVMFAATSSATTGSSHCQPVAIHEPDAGKHADTGPDIGEQMMRVGFERDGIVFASGAQHEQRDDQIYDGGGEGDGEADAQFLQRLGRDQAQGGGHGDADGGDEDQAAFEAAGKVFGFAVTVRVVLVGGARGDGQHGQRHDAAEEIDERLDRIRKQTHRAGDEIRGSLQPDREQGGSDGEPGKAGEGFTGFRHAEMLNHGTPKHTKRVCPSERTRIAGGM
jgi:hypothetical protein